MVKIREIGKTGSIIGAFFGLKKPPFRRKAAGLSE